MAMSGFFVNEMHCLTNAVTQSCLRHQLLVTQGVPPLVRRLIQKHAVSLGCVRRIELHQCPQAAGFIEYTLAVFTRDGMFREEFQSPGKDADHGDFVLYDQRRDGVAQYLHLQH